MPRNDDGEYELILGNRQVMSVFFMVAVLVVVFFTMGYIVGRNSSPQATEPVPIAQADPLPAPVVRGERDPVPTPSQPAASGTAAQQPAETSAPTSAAPASRETRTEAPKPDSAAAAKRIATVQPVAGKSYLQLAATSEHEAGVLVDVLRKKGFKSVLAEIEEKPGTYRVLVGPVEDSTANRTRADLQDAGFPGNAAIRRTF